MLGDRGRHVWGPIGDVDVVVQLAGCGRGHIDGLYTWESMRLRASAGADWAVSAVGSSEVRMRATFFRSGWHWQSDV